MKLNIILLTTTLILSSCTSGKHKESTGQFIDSSAITAKVKTALLQDKRVSALDVSVKTYKGVVQLSGFVQTSAQRSAAEEIAEGIEGVESVENALVVKDH